VRSCSHHGKRTLGLVNQHVHELFELAPRGRSVISRVGLYSPEVSRLSLLQSLIPAKPRLKSLHIEIDYFSTSFRKEEEPPVVVNFESLAALIAKSLRNVGINVVFRRCSREGKILHAKLIEELSSLGMRLLGGEGVEDFKAGRTGELAWSYEFTRTSK
jgi:hypothetical protein